MYILQKHVRNTHAKGSVPYMYINTLLERTLLATEVLQSSTHLDLIVKARGLEAALRNGVEL